jgi:hypothetical protein
MREIKFRALKDGKLVYDITKHHMEHNELTPMGGDVFDFADWLKYYQVTQYTGLKDKNDKEIYEGDIVKSEHERGVVVIKFGEGYQGEPADGMYPYWGWYTDGWFDRYAFDGDDIEIIGNIYENPELLEADKNE